MNLCTTITVINAETTFCALTSKYYEFLVAVDCSRAGPGDLGVDITHNGRLVTAHISPTVTLGYKKVTFMPYESGPYEINVHFNRAEVRGE